MKIKPWIIILVAALLLVADQVSKIVVKLTMTIGESYDIVGRWVQIYFIENAGAAYGMQLDGDWGKLALSLFRVALSVLLVIYIRHLYKTKAPRGVVISFVAIFVGAIGNLFDSMFYGMIFSESTTHEVAQVTAWGEGYTGFLHGKVVDMLYCPIVQIDMMPQWVPIWGGEPFVFFSPIFNMADAYISVAVIYLFIFQRNYFTDKPEIPNTKKSQQI